MTRINLVTLLVATYHDIKSGIYYPPFYVKTHTEALRTFEQDVKRKADTTLALYPSDFTLEILGEFTDNGTITPYQKPLIIATGSEFTNNQPGENLVTP